MGTKTYRDKNTLVVTWTAFPPTSGSGVIVSNLLAQFDPTKIVLAGEHTFGADLSKYEKPAYPFYLLEHAYHTGVKGSKYFKWLAYRKVLKQIDEIIAKHNIELIFGIFPDEFYTYVACKAAKKHKLPFYSWFHNTYLDNREGILKRLAQKVQPEIFEYSKKIFTMSQGMNDFYVKQYPDHQHKIFPLLHGFNIPQGLEQVDTKINGAVKFLLSGNINHSNRDSTERLAKAVLNQHENNELHIYGGNSAEEWAQMGISGDKVFLHGFVPLSQLVASFKDHDIMLLPHGFEGDLSPAEYLTIFPTRTIPLLYSGKPILAHSPPNTAITKMLQNKACALVIEEKNNEALKQAIENLIAKEDLRITLVQQAIQASEDYNVSKIATNLKKEFFS